MVTMVGTAVVVTMAVTAVVVMMEATAAVVAVAAWEVLDPWHLVSAPVLWVVCFSVKLLTTFSKLIPAWSDPRTKSIGNSCSRLLHIFL